MNRLTSRVRLLAILMLVAATPATKPTTTRVLNDRDSTVVASKKRGLEFRVPKNVSRSTTGVPAGSEDEVFVFNMDGGGGAKKPSPPVGGFPSLSVFVTEPCERPEHLAEVVNETKRKMPEVNSGSELVEDHAVEINGEPGWLLRWKRDVDVKVVKVDAKGARTDAPGQKLSMMRQKVMFVRNKTICDVGLFCAKANFDRLVGVADAVAASIQMTAN